MNCMSLRGRRPSNVHIMPENKQGQKIMPSYSRALGGKSMNLSPSYFRAPQCLRSWIFLFYIQQCSKNFHSYQCSFRIPNIYFLIYLLCLKFSGVFLPQYNILLLSYSNFSAWPQTPNFFYPQALVLIQKSIHCPYDFPILFIPKIFIHFFLLVGDLFHEEILLSHFEQ